MLEQADLDGKKLLLAGGTKLNPGSWSAALLAAGCSLSAMQSILDGRTNQAFALVRPPGHHAQPSQADGYCFLNNAGIACHLAIDRGCQRVAVVDIDVHFGNGTSEGFYERSDVLTISLHMDHGPWGSSHPQSLKADQVGKGNGKGFNLNIPLPNGTGDKGYEMAMTELVVPAINAFKPDMVVFVIGQDSSQFDPNGRMCLTMSGYRNLGRIMKSLSDTHCGGKILVVQEGGYHITYSAYCLHATLEGVIGLELPLLEDPIAYYPEDITAAKAQIEAIKQIIQSS